MSEQQLRIGIDCRLAGKKHAGIGRYVENLVRRLPVAAPHIQWIFFFFDGEQAREVLDGKKYNNVKIVFAPVRHYSLFEQIKMPGIFAAEKLDILHVPHFNIPLFYQGKIVVTIHDLLWHEYHGLDVTTLPAWQYHIKHILYKFVVEQAVQRAGRIFVPAETIRQTVARYYPSVKNKIVVTKEGIDPTYQKISTRQATQRKKQLIYVGSLYPHKNIKVAIDALEKLPEFQLFLAGTRTVFVDDVRRYVSEKRLTSRVKFLGYVSDEYLTQLYKESFALVQPSFSEGFGLTGLEAMAAGCPVIASDIPLFKEIYQDAVVYFDPKSSKDFQRAVIELEKMDAHTLLKKAEKISHQYSWDEMTKQTLSEYQKLS